MTKRIFGTGSYTYDIHHTFGNLPDGWTWGNVSNVACDGQDRVYAFQRKDPPIVIFDSQGNYLSSWGDGQMVDAHGIFIAGDDTVFLLDRDAHEMLKYTLDGTLLMRIGTRDEAHLQKPFNHPADVAIAPNGDIFIADGYGNSVIHHYSPDGNYIKSFGIPGEEFGEFSTPHGIWVDKDALVYVADRENNSIQIFDPEGTFITAWTDFYHPMDIWQDHHDVFYVTDQTSRVSVLSPDGTLLSRSRAPDAGHGIYGDSLGNLYLSAAFRGIAKMERK
jgi:DNA-binding beta-propeller fold protein YncE